MGRRAWVICADPKCSDKCPYKKEAGGNLTHADRAGGLVKMEAGAGGTQPQAKECLEPPETGGVQEGASPRGFGGSAEDL